MHLLAGKKLALWQIDAAGIVVCIVAALVAYSVGIRPLIEQRSFLADQRKTLITKRKESSDIEASMLKLNKQLEFVREQLAQGEIKLESADQINRRIAELTALFSDCTLEVDDVQTGNIFTGPKCDLVPISIAARGGYKQCVAFLHNLHRTFADISVAGFELGGNPARPEQPATFRFQLLWHTVPKARTAKNSVFENFCERRSYGLGFI